MKNIASALWLIMLAFSACIPASPPPNLGATPGEGAVVTGDTYRNDLFSVEYPAGWRVITSPAGAPPSVTFVAPGDCALIVVSSAPIDQPPVSPSCTQPDIQTAAFAITLGNQPIAIAGSAPAAEWDSFLTALNRVTESLQ